MKVDILETLGTEYEYLCIGALYTGYSGAFIIHLLWLTNLKWNNKKSRTNIEYRFIMKMQGKGL